MIQKRRIRDPSRFVRWRPLLCTMEDAEYLEPSLLNSNAINNDELRSCNDQFAGFADPSHPAQFRITCKTLHCVKDQVALLKSSFRILVGNIGNL